MTEAVACAPSTAVMLRVSGASSTPRLVRSMTNASGILDRPVGPTVTVEGAASSPPSHTCLYTPRRAAPESLPHSFALQTEARELRPAGQPHGHHRSRTQNIENNPMQSSLAVAGMRDSRENTCLVGQITCNITHRAIRKTQTHVAPGALPEDAATQLDLALGPAIRRETQPLEL